MDLTAPFLAEPEASENNCELLRFLWTNGICPVMEPVDSAPRLHWAHHHSCSHWQLSLTRQGTGSWGVGGPSQNDQPPRASKLSLGGLKLVARSQPTIYLLGGQPNFQLQTEAHA